LAPRSVVRLACLALSVLLAPAAGQLDPAAVLGRHVEALGGEAALAAAGDLLVEGRFEDVRGVFQLRILVRREPFAVREEWRSSDWDPASPPMVVVTDLRHAWQMPRQPRGAESASSRGSPLPFTSALPLSQRAMAWKLLLRPLDHVTGAQFGPPPFALPDAPFFHDDFAEAREALTVVVRGSLGLTPNGWFDALDGRWLGWQVGPLTDGLHRLRVGRWHDVAGLRLPSAFLEFTDGGLIGAVFVDRFTAGLRHDDGLFLGSPGALPLDAPLDLAPLHVAPTETPGTLRLFVGDLRLDGAGPLWGLLDTGADKLVADEQLVAQLALPYVAPSRFAVLLGEGTAPMHWLDRLGLGRLELAQQLVVSHDVPIPRDAWDVEPIGLIVGTAALNRLSPVFDLRGGRLLARGDTPAPLSTLAPAGPAATAHATCALHPDPDGPGTALIEAEVAGRRVRALFDTGFTHLLRLSAGGLQALGLPAGRDEWLRRGARPYGVFGAAGAEAEDLLVQLDEVVLPAVSPEGRAVRVTYRQPWVIVAPHGSPASGPEHFDAILGAAALRPFARVGLDTTRDLLELEAGDGVSVEDTVAATRWVVAAPGGYVGLVLERGAPAQGAQAGTLPRVAEVDAGFAAERAGVRPGDVLVAIDGTPCDGKPLSDLLPRLWVPEGQSVELRLRRGAGEEFVVRLN
jgi:hypothetical protein